MYASAPRVGTMQHSHWFECVRNQNPQTNATVGFLHPLGCIMAAQSYWQGPRVYYDSSVEQITDIPPRRS